MRSSDGGQRFANLIQQLHAIVWEADPVTLQTTLVSDYAEQILGYPTEQWLTEHDFWIRHIHPEDREQTISTIRAAIREQRNCHLEYRMFAADGHSIWFRDLVQIELSRQGRPQRLLGVMLDIEERKSTEEELRESEERFLALLHHEREAWGAAERRAMEETALRQAIEAISIHFTVDSVIQQIAASGISATNADGAFVEKVDPHLREAEVVAAAGELPPALGERVPYAGSYVEAVLGTGEPVLLERVADANRSFHSSIIERCPDCAALIIPLIDAGEAVGALTLLRRRERWSFRPDEIARARVFSNLAALAFGKAHLLHDAQNKRSELERVIESRDRLGRGGWISSDAGDGATGRTRGTATEKHLQDPSRTPLRTGIDRQPPRTRPGGGR
jgi:PAS domain S-box-containing protein